MDRLSGIFLDINRLFINRPHFVYAQNFAQPKSKGHPEGWPVQKKSTPRGREDVQWHAVVIIVSSQATYNQVIDWLCSCILVLGTDTARKGIVKRYIPTAGMDRLSH